jgi:hypothetical protein
MSVPEPLRYSPFRMYRRKSFYTGLYGTNHSGPTRPPGDITASSGVPIRSVGSPAHRAYSSDHSDEYAPRLGPMHMPGRSYQPYDSSGIPNMPRPDHSMTMDELQMAALGLARDNTLGPEIKYEDSLMNEDFFQIQMKLQNKEFDGPPVIPFDNNQLASAILRGHQRNEASELDYDLMTSALEIQMAVERTRLGANTEPADIGLAIPQDFFEQQDQILEDQLRYFEAPEFDYGAEMESMFSAQEALFDLLQSEASPMKRIMSDQFVEDMGLLAVPGAESLEKIIEDHEMPDGMTDSLDYENSLMTTDPFGMEEIAEPIEPMETNPDPIPDDYDMLPQEMYDEQLPGMADQYMAPDMADPYMSPDMMDPYMMPGIMDPYMMPGPFGPGPILDPGPGGPP